MTATAYLAEEVPEDRLVHGYVRRDETLRARGHGPVRRARVDGRRLLVRGGPGALGGRVLGRLPSPRRPGGRSPAPPQHPSRDAAGPPRDAAPRSRPTPPRWSRRSSSAGTGSGCSCCRGPGPRDDRQPRRRLPGVRLPHGVAPGDRARGDRPRQRPVRAGSAGGGGDAGDAGPGGGRSRGGASSRSRRWSGSAPVAEGLLAGWDDAVADAVVRDEHGPRRAAGPAARGGRRSLPSSWARSARTRRVPAPCVIARGSRLVAARVAWLGARVDPRHAGAGAAAAAARAAAGRRSVAGPADGRGAGDRPWRSTPGAPWPDDLPVQRGPGHRGRAAVAARRRCADSGRCGSALPVDGDGRTSSTFEI